MNKVFLSGRLTKDPELTNAKQYTLCKFALAVNKFSNGKNETVFINCVAWGKIAETLHQYTRKGSMLLIDGELQTNSFQTKEGVKVSETYVNVIKVEFLSPKNEKSTSTAAQESSIWDEMLEKENKRESNYTPYDYQNNYQNDLPQGEKKEVSEDDLPF